MFLSPAQLSEHCKALVNPNWFVTFIAAGLVVGILASYVPQHLKIWSNKSSEGLSPYWVLLGGLSSICAFGNIITLPTSREDMKCCKVLDGGDCAAALLGVAQIVVQFSCFMIIVGLFVGFYPATSNINDTSEGPNDHTAYPKQSEKVLVGSVIPIAAVLVATFSVVLIEALPRYTQTWADALGLVAGVLAAIQYLPQIYFTWKLQDMKSLSVLTLAVQAPGAFVFAASLAVRVGFKHGWSTWLPYVVTGLLQFVLLGMAAVYHVRSKQSMGKRRPNGLASEDHEREPLLPNTT